MLNGLPRRPFLRRTKPTRATETSTEPIATTRSNLPRGPGRFKTRTQNTTARAEQPTRTYLRRRVGASATTATSSSSSASTAAVTSRRALFVSRRRNNGATTLSPTTTEPLPNEPTLRTTQSATAFVESEEVLQDIGEIDYLEDSQATTDLPRTTEYVQRRRPLVQLQIKTEDQTIAATNEEEKKRQSKKYSSSFKQTDLNEIIRLRTSGEEVDVASERKANTESYTSETAAAVALAAHQLLAAPVPVTTDYDEDIKTRSQSTTYEPFKYTTAYSITQQSEDLLKTPAYTSSKKYYDPTSNTYSSRESVTFNTDTTNSRSAQKHTTIEGFTGRVSKSQDEELVSTVPTYTETTATKTSRRLNGRYRSRVTKTESDIISTIQPSTYEPVTNRGTVKYNGEFVDSYSGLTGFGYKGTYDQGFGKYSSGGSDSRYRISGDASVTTDSTYEDRTIDARGPAKYATGEDKSTVSTLVENSEDVVSNVGVSATDERGSGKYSANRYRIGTDAPVTGSSFEYRATGIRGPEKYNIGKTGKYQGSVSTFESNVQSNVESNVQTANVGVQTATDERGSGKYSVNRYRINSEVPVTTDSTYEYQATGIRGPEKYSSGKYEGSAVSTFESNVQSNVGVQSATDERGSGKYSVKRYRINSEVPVTTDSTFEYRATDIRGPEKYSSGKYQGSVSTFESNAQSNVESNVGVQSATEERGSGKYSVKRYRINSEVPVTTDATYEYRETDGERGPEKYSSGKYEGSLSTFESNIQSNLESNVQTATDERGSGKYSERRNRYRINSEAPVTTDSSYEYQASGIRGPEKYSSGKYQGSVSTFESNVESNVGVQSATDERGTGKYSVNRYRIDSEVPVTTDATYEATTDIRGPEKYSRRKYKGSLTTFASNVEVQSNGAAQSNTGAQSLTDERGSEKYLKGVNKYSAGADTSVTTDATYEDRTADVRGASSYSAEENKGTVSTFETNANIKSGVNVYHADSQSIISTAPLASGVKETTRYGDIRGTETYSTGKYQASVSTIETNANSSGSSAQYNANAQSTANIQYGADAGTNVGTQYNAETTDIRGSEKYFIKNHKGSITTTDTKYVDAKSSSAQYDSSAQSKVQFGAGVETNVESQSNAGAQTDLRGSEKYNSTVSAIETNVNVQSGGGAQYNADAQSNTNAQTIANVQNSASVDVNAGAQYNVNIQTDSGSEKYTNRKYKGRTTTVRRKYVDVTSASRAQLNASAQSNTNAQSNVNVQSSTIEQSNTNAQYNANQQIDLRGSEKYKGFVSTNETSVDIQSGAGVQYNAGQYVASVDTNAGSQYNVNTQTDLRGSDKYTGSVSSVESTVGVQSGAGAQYNAGQYIAGVQTNVETQNSANVQTDLRGSEKYNSSVSSVETNVNVQSGTGSQYNSGQYVASVDTNAYSQYNADRQTDLRGSDKYTGSQYNAGQYIAGVQTNIETQNSANIQTDLRGSEKYKGSISTVETNVDVQSGTGSQYNAGQYVAGVDTNVYSQFNADRQTDLRGSDKYTGSVSSFETNANVQSGTGSQYNAGQYVAGVQTNVQTQNSANIQTDLRGSEKYNSSVSSVETNVNVQSGTGAQYNAGQYVAGVQTKVETQNSANIQTDSEKYKGSVSTVETNVQSGREAQYRDVAQSNSNTQTNVNVQYGAVVDTKAAKYTNRKNKGRTTTIRRKYVDARSGSRAQLNASTRSNTNAQSTAYAQTSTIEQSNANVQSNAQYNANRQTDVRGSEKYKGSVSTIETNVDLQSGAGAQYNAGQYVASVDTNAYSQYNADRRTDLRGSDKYNSSVSSVETNVNVQSGAGAQYNAGQYVASVDTNAGSQYNVNTQTDIRGSEKYSAEKYKDSVTTVNTNYVDVKSTGGVQYNAQSNTNAHSNAVQYGAGVETNIETQHSADAQTDIRGSEKFKGSVSSIETSVNTQSGGEAQYIVGTQSNTNTQSDISKQLFGSGEEANVQFNLSAQSNKNAQSNVEQYGKGVVTNIEVQRNANIQTADVRGSEKYKGSVSSIESIVDVQSGGGAQYNTGTQTVNVQYGAGVDTNASAQYNANVQTDISGSEKYSEGKYKTSVTTINTKYVDVKSGGGAQYNASAQSNTDAQTNVNVQYNAAQYGAGVETNAAAQYQANAQTDVRGSEKYKDTKVSTFETDVNVQSGGGAQYNAGAESSANAQSNINVQYGAGVETNAGAQYSADIRGSEKYSAVNYKGSVSTVETNVNTQSTDTELNKARIQSSGNAQYAVGAQYNGDGQTNGSAQYADVQTDVQYKNGQSISRVKTITSTVPITYEFNATDERGSSKYNTGTYKGTVTNVQSSANGKTVSSTRPSSYRVRTAVRRPTKFSGGYRNRVNKYESNADAISTIQPTTYEAETTDVRGETKYSTGEYRDSLSQFESSADGYSTIQPPTSTYEIKTRGPERYWSGQYKSRTSVQTDADGFSTLQPTTYETDTTDVRGSSRYSTGEYRGRVSEIQTNTDIPAVSTIASTYDAITDTRGPIRYSTVNEYYNENTDGDVLHNHISTTYAPEVVNTRVPTRFTTANPYRGTGFTQTGTEIPSTVSTISEYSFDSTIGKSGRTSQTGYRGRISGETEISESTSSRTDTRQPTRLITGSFSGKGTRPTIASESILNLTLSGETSESNQERGASKYYVTSDVTDIREPAQFSSSLDLRGSARLTSSETLTGRTVSPGFVPQNTIDPILSGITINIGAVKGDSTARYNSATDGSATTVSNNNYESRKSSQSGATKVVSSANEVSISESSGTISSSEIKSARPTGFTPSLVNLGEISGEKSYKISQKSKTYQVNGDGASTARYVESNEKIPVPVIFAYSESGSSSSQSSSSSSSQEPAYFTREYLLESPVTKTYDEEYQYLSPVTTPSTTSRKSVRRKIYRKNNQTPTVTTSTTTTETPSSTVASSTAKQRRTTTVKPFQKLTVRRVPLTSVQKITLSKKEIEEAKQQFKPAKDYDYYDDNHEKIAKYDGTKVILRGEGNIQCLDIGNFPHPTSCKKFISCARIESGAVLGWEYICPKGLSFDPVGGICNWSAGLGCNEKDV